MYPHKSLSNTSLAHITSHGKALTIAHRIAIANDAFSQMLGRMFTQSIQKSYALIFPLGYERYVSLHMRFVPYDLGAIYITDNTIQKITVMDSWAGLSSGTADVIIETHPELLTNLTVGDELYLQGNHTISELEKPTDAPKEPWFLTE